MKEIARRKENYDYFFTPETEPILTVKPSETVLIRTEDAFSGQILTNRDVGVMKKMGTELQWNPVSGPIYVEGAEPGDNLVVHIKDITVGGPRNQGVVSIIPQAGVMDYSQYILQSSLEPIVTVCSIKRGKVLFPTKSGRTIRIPVQPIIGALGVAPTLGKIPTFWHSQDICGNTDSPDITVGTKVTLPINVDGALFSVGDVAAVSGDGEIVSHVDTQGDITLTFDLIKKENTKYVAWPQIETTDYIGSIGCPLGAPLTDAIRAACKDMILRLERFYGFDLMDAYQLLTLVAEIRINQVVNGLGDGCCIVKIRKRYIE